jgi:hypothetical protein
VEEKQIVPIVTSHEDKFLITALQGIEQSHGISPTQAWIILTSKGIGTSIKPMNDWNIIPFLHSLGDLHIQEKTVLLAPGGAVESREWSFWRHTIDALGGFVLVSINDTFNIWGRG